MEYHPIPPNIIKLSFLLHNKLFSSSFEVVFYIAQQKPTFTFKNHKIILLIHYDHFIIISCKTLIILYLRDSIYHMILVSFIPFIFQNLQKEKRSSNNYSNFYIIILYYFRSIVSLSISYSVICTFVLMIFLKAH